MLLKSANAKFLVGNKLSHDTPVQNRYEKQLTVITVLSLVIAPISPGDVNLGVHVMSHSHFSKSRYEEA